MKRNFKRLKYNFLFYFIIFSVAILFLVWLLQIVFLEANFKNNRDATLKSYGEEICESLESGEEISETAVLELKQLGASVVVVKRNLNDDIVFLYSSTQISTENSDNSIYPYAISAIELNNIDAISSSVKLTDGENFLFYACKTVYRGESAYLVISCSMAYLKDTVNLLQKQLIVVGVIVIVICVLFAYLISIKLAKPIDNMSKVAKIWAEGNNKVHFEGGEYSELDELATTLNYAKEEVLKSGKLQRDLLANVSHDLKTPLTLIKSYAEMIKDISGNNKEKREKHTQVIIDEADRLTSLVNDILKLSKLQSDVDALEISKFNLSELCETVISRFQTVYEHSGYTIEKKIQENLYVKADEKKIEQVIYNLLGNSINYTGEDKTVKVFLSSENKNIILEILDSGKGIDKNSVETIWNKYYRLSETHKRPTSGTGLGLSIVKAILDAHKLEYGVISKQNVGSNFYVRFGEEDENE